MKWNKSLGEAIALSSISTLILFYILLTYSGLKTGIYRIILDSNMFFEHYIEFALLIIGGFFYIKYRRIRFTLHPKKD